MRLISPCSVGMRVSDTCTETIRVGTFPGFRGTELSRVAMLQVLLGCRRKAYFNRVFNIEILRIKAGVEPRSNSAMI
ncbi:hypothetical protein AMA2_43 [Achromobacter phage AMA2]|nr:hypothetical protein AMA2_43 [Achromobacter phage AMA2]